MVDAEILRCEACPERQADSLMVQTGSSVGFALSFLPLLAWDRHGPWQWMDGNQLEKTSWEINLYSVGYIHAITRNPDCNWCDLLSARGEGLQILAKIDNQRQYLRHANHPKVMDRYGWMHRFISASLCTLKASCKALVRLYTSNHLHVTSPSLSISDLSWLGTWGWYSFFLSKRIEIALHYLQAFLICFQSYSVTLTSSIQQIVFCGFLQLRPAFPVERQVQAFAAHPPAPQLSKSARLPQLSSWFL